MASGVRMTGRERIRAAFAHQGVDRAPLFDQSISSELAGAVLGRPALVGGGALRFLEVEARFRGAAAAAEFEERLLRDVAEFYRTMGYDLARLPWRDRRRAALKLDERTYLFGDPERRGPWEVYRFSPESDNWHELEGWLSGGDVDALARWLEEEGKRWQGPDHDPRRFDSLRQLKSLLGEEIALAATVASIGVPMYEAAWLMAIEVCPSLVEEELDRQLAQGLADIAGAAAAGAIVMHAGLDFCLNSGPVFSPATFDRMILPRLQQLAQACDSHGVYYVFRTDGNTWPVAESLFGKSGIHAYAEIDRGAGMRLNELRARFPRLTLFGNMDCGGALLTGTPSQVRAETREILEETGAIGHIFGASNLILAGTPTENYLAMLEEARAFTPAHC